MEQNFACLVAYRANSFQFNKVLQREGGHCVHWSVAAEAHPVVAIAGHAREGFLRRLLDFFCGVAGDEIEQLGTEGAMFSGGGLVNVRISWKMS